MLENSRIVCLSKTDVWEVPLSMEDTYIARWFDPIDHSLLLCLQKKVGEWWITNENALQLKEAKLQWDHAYEIVLHKKRCLLYVSLQYHGEQHYRFYTLPNHGTLTIGRKKGDIRFNHELISTSHARLRKVKVGWVMEDLHSTNGVYVNTKRMESKVLELGDCIYIMGLQILYGKDFIAINEPLGCMPMPKDLIPYQPEAQSLPSETREYAQLVPMIRYEPYEMPVCELKDAPINGKRDHQPLLYMLGPSITMSLGSLSSSLFLFYNASINQQPLSTVLPSLVMTSTMILGTMLWPWLSYRYELHQEMIAEQKRNACYEAYLKKQQECLDHLLAKKAESLRELYQDVTQPIQLWRFELPKTELWVCIGIGDLKVASPFQGKETPLSIKEDPLIQRKALFLQQDCVLHDVPVFIQTKSLHVCYVIGSSIDRLAYAKYILMHHVLLYAPQHAIVLLAMDQTMNAKLPRFLPHQFSDDGYRFLCYDMTALPEALMHLHQAHLPVLVLSFAPAFTSFFLRHVKDLPLVVMAFHEAITQGERIHIEKAHGHYRDCAFTWQQETHITQIADMICNIKEDCYPHHFPKQLSFLAMYRVERIAQLAIEKRWQNSDSETSLKAPLGVMADGEVMVLDLHERTHGPHGIVAGMTGSGKSELLITMLLSLAVNYHPYDCAFILIDYKGGGMAKALERLPHTAGIITNLDGNMIARSLNSLHAEVLRRQRIFAEVMEAKGLPSMNIDVYQKLYHEKQVKAIVPHLIITADEFAELKQQEPQFMEQLIRIARIGRSLGIHLILATQKPAGIVDDQIWSNARFHICLKVADKGDSMDMLKREDGAHIKAVGRFYLQVGYDEIFTEGQCAYTKAIYDPDQEGLGKVLLAQLHHDGRIRKEWKRNYPHQQMQSEINALIDTMDHLAKAQQIDTPRLWLDPLPDELLATEVSKGDIALVDDPLKQRQFTLNINQQRCNTLLFAQDMKIVSDVIKTWIVAWSEIYDARNHHIVIIDGSQGTLCTYQKIAHVYAALSLDDEEDVRFVMQQLTREKRKAHQQAQWLLIVHHVAAFLEMFEDGEAWLSYLARDHGACGITLLLSCGSINEIRHRLFRQFENMFVFHMQDEQEVHSLIGPSWHLIDHGHRAMWKQREQVYEVQFVSGSNPTMETGFESSCKMVELPQEIAYQKIAEPQDEEYLAIGYFLEDRTIAKIPAKGVWIISGRQGADFVSLLKQINDTFHRHMRFYLSLDEVTNAGMEIVLLSPSQLSMQMHHVLVEKCRQEQRILWCGSGFDEYRYLWDLPSCSLPQKKQDALWIGEEVMLLRCISKL